MDLYSEARILPYLLRGRLDVRDHRDLVAVGLSRSAIEWRAGRAGLVRAHRSVYLDGPHAPDLLDLARATLAVCAPGTLLGFHTAAALYGFGVLDSAEIHVVMEAGASIPQRRGIAVHQTVLGPGPAVEVRGLPCVTAARCAIDLARTVPAMDGLPVLDAAIASLATDRDALLREVAIHSGLRGVRRAHRLVELADGRAECRQESQLRLLVVEAGIPGFVPQLEVRGRSGFPRFFLDLADPERRIGLEYDGASHLDKGRLRLDRQRHNWLETRGWRMRYFTDHDLYRCPDDLVSTLRVSVGR